MLRWIAWWVFSTLTNLMGGKLMVKKHNLHKCTCPFFLFWPFLIRSSLAECQLNNQLLGLTSRVQNMVVMVVKIQTGVYDYVQDLTKFCLNVNLEKENDIVTGLKKSPILVLKRTFLSLCTIYLIFWFQIQASSFYNIIYIPFYTSLFWKKFILGKDNWFFKSSHRLIAGFLWMCSILKYKYL